MAAKLTDVPSEFVIRYCDRCHTPYDTRKTRAFLRFTYCGAVCEGNGLGFDIDHATRKDADWAHAPKRDPEVVALISEAVAAAEPVVAGTDDSDLVPA